MTLPLLLDDAEVKVLSIDNKFPDDPCLLDKAVGICRAAMRRYHFDPETKTCEKFTYSGEEKRRSQKSFW